MHCSGIAWTTFHNDSAFKILYLTIVRYIDTLQYYVNLHICQTKLSIYGLLYRVCNCIIDTRLHDVNTKNSHVCFNCFISICLKVRYFNFVWLSTCSTFRNAKYLIDKCVHNADRIIISRWTSDLICSRRTCHKPITNIVLAD